MDNLNELVSVQARHTFLKCTHNNTFLKKATLHIRKRILILADCLSLLKRCHAHFCEVDLQPLLILCTTSPRCSACFTPLLPRVFSPTYFPCDRNPGLTVSSKDSQEGYYFLWGKWEKKFLSFSLSFCLENADFRVLIQSLSSMENEKLKPIPRLKALVAEFLIIFQTILIKKIVHPKECFS